MTTPTLSAWKEGVSLWEAVAKYSNEDLWNSFVALSEELNPKIPEAPPDEPIKWEPTPPLQEDPVRRYQELNHKLGLIEDQLKSEIITSLIAEVLLAVGYVPPRFRGRNPVWIDSNCWRRGQVDWERSELWINGNRFEEVRVIRPPASMAAEAIASISPAKPPRSPGQPSRAKEITAAYMTLEDEGKIDFALSFRANLPTIRQGVHALSGSPSNERGLKDEAIRRAVGEQFKRDKAACKSSR